VPQGHDTLTYRVDGLAPNLTVKSTLSRRYRCVLLILLFYYLPNAKFICWGSCLT